MHRPIELAHVIGMWPAAKSQFILENVYFPYCLTALPIDGPAAARSCGFMIGRKETFALNA